MNRIKQFLKYDAWIMILDVAAVNASYFLALCIRFYVNFHFESNIDYYLGYYYKFVPFYTVICLLVFSAFRLYGGIWIYAGLSDMYRIVGACFATTILHIVGTRLFFARMPASYYIIGAFLQFMAIVLIRFSYRLIQIEKRRIEKRREGIIPAMVVGSGSFGRKVVHHLEDNTPYRAIVIAGNDAGRKMEGIPIVSLDAVMKTIAEKQIKAVFIADKDLSKDSREAIILASKDLEFSDFTGHMSNESGFLPLTNLLEVMDMPIQVDVDGKITLFSSAEQCLSALPGEYDVLRVQATKLFLKKREEDKSWMKVYQEQTGRDVSFFD
ncbi:MAG: hypothetical protein Q4E94_06175 [Clostridia bacterium]|nr:hypothetical protein [Clostridia bacterium]